MWLSGIVFSTVDSQSEGPDLETDKASFSFPFFASAAAFRNFLYLNNKHRVLC